MADTLSFFELPNNTFGGALIPITSNVTPLASVTIRAEAGFPVILRGAAGWTAVTNAPGTNRTEILFKIWRGAPITGTEIYSTADSGEVFRDRSKVTAFSHADAGFGGTQNVTYTLTAQLPGSGAANIVGPLTLTASVST